jgi:hypothetical protein
MALAILCGWMILGIFSIKNLTNPVGLVGLAVFALSTVALFLALRKGSTPFAPGTIFFANRLAKDNLFFPTQFLVTPESVIRHKGRWIGAEEESISISQVASVKIDTGLFWSNVVVESTGGADPIRSHGHSNTDALAIQRLIREFQTVREVPSTPPAASPAPPEREEWITVALVAPPMEPDMPPFTLASTTSHLPPRTEEAGLDSIVAQYLGHGPDGSWITIAKVPVPIWHPGGPTGLRPPMAASDLPPEHRFPTDSSPRGV